MRVLLLMRGAPGVGKTTYIRQNELEKYALCADDIRMMYQSPVMQVDGTEQIAFQNDKAVWETLFELLEARMQRGEFVVIDATNSKTVEMNRYKKLAETYRYRIYCVDFTKVPIQICKEQNRTRKPYQRVPEAAIDNMYARFATQKIPSGIVAIKPEELNKIWFKPIDLSEFKKVHHIGDIHGCNSALQEYLKDGLKDDEFYIFAGDYIDRGIENAETLKYLMQIADNRNVLMLEGNHERWLWYWSHGEMGTSKEFEMVTKKELNEANLDPKEVRNFYRRLGQCAWYKYGDKMVFVCHAGISTIPKNLTTVATDQMIRGVGRYGDYLDVANSFMRTTKDNVYQIFGHRNTEDSPVQLNDRVFNLEGKVEFGGHLRVVTLDENGFTPIEIKNTVFKPVPVEKKEETLSNSIVDVVNRMRKSKFVNEKQFGNISSFNFTRDAFYDKHWDEQTVKARGLFINTATGEVVARSYDKWFQINERPETEYDNLPRKLDFPVTAYVKENGFLGLVSYNKETDAFIICSKSTPEGPFARYMKDAFDKNVKNREELKEFLKNENVTLVFECVDIVNDPHIIEYDKSHLFLLDAVYNKIEYEKMPYRRLQEIGDRFGFEIKKKAVELASWQEFKDWYAEVTADDYLYEGKEIEGFVLEDASGFMLKLKLPYYSFWKHMRSVANEVFRSGNYRHTSSLVTPEGNLFFGFCKEIRDEENHPTKIIELRKLFKERMKAGAP